MELTAIISFAVLASKIVYRKNVASFPVPIPSFSILHVEKIGEPRDEAIIYKILGNLVSFSGPIPWGIIVL